MSVAAVIVTYFPDSHKLARLLGTLRTQADYIVVVDNGSTESTLAGYRYCHCITLPENRGIAVAQNIGIEWAKAQGADFVLLSDQDSEPASDMVVKLLDAYEQLVGQGYKVAAVGPRYFDARQNNPPPFIRVEGLRLVRCRNPEKNEVVQVDYLISSGCLIPVSVLDAVGGMTEELFIDYVDIEWGLRAKRYGYQSFGVFYAHMMHSLGDSPAQFLGRNIPVHSPLRHYYHFRNAVWLYRQAWPPLNWKVADAWRLVLKFGFYSLFAEPRFEQLKMMTMGVWHGIRGHMGR